MAFIIRIILIFVIGVEGKNLITLFPKDTQETNTPCQVRVWILGCEAIMKGTGMRGERFHQYRNAARRKRIGEGYVLGVGTHVHASRTFLEDLRRRSHRDE